MPHQCQIGDHEYASLLDAHGRRLCHLCGRPECPADAEDDATDFYQSNDLEDAFEYLLRTGVAP